MTERLIERFVAGIIGPPFGLEGFVKFRSFSGETAHLKRLASITLRKNGVESVFPVEEMRSRGASGEGVIRFAGFDSPEKAKALGGSEIMVSRKDAAPLGKGEYYIEDLKGLSVVAGAKTPDAKAGTVFGVVTGVYEGGGGSLLEVKLGDDGFSRDVMRLVPFRDEFIGEVSLKKGTVVLLAPWVLE
ncbi:MAG: ribosome maturation factor RimM [Spirochaetaceae bacterium]|nr:ribosome maturation factor RimM [Spirochaetaceae bacterium]